VVGNGVCTLRAAIHVSNTYGGGTITFEKDTDDDVRKYFDYAKGAGMPLMVVTGDAKILPRVERFAKEYDIKVAIHNHGPEDKHYPSPYDVLKHVRTMDRRMGLCIDIGHTVRTGTDVVKAIADAGPRLGTVQSLAAEQRSNRECKRRGGGGGEAGAEQQVESPSLDGEPQTREHGDDRPAEKLFDDIRLHADVRREVIAQSTFRAAPPIQIGRTANQLAPPVDGPVLVEREVNPRGEPRQHVGGRQSRIEIRIQLINLSFERHPNRIEDVQERSEERIIREDGRQIREQATAVTVERN